MGKKKKIHILYMHWMRHVNSAEAQLSKTLSTEKADWRGLKQKFQENNVIKYDKKKR